MIADDATDVYLFRVTAISKQIKKSNLSVSYWPTEIIYQLVQKKSVESLSLTRHRLLKIWHKAKISD